PPSDSYTLSLHDALPISAVQSRLRYSSRVKAALKRETGFLRRVIKCADDEVFPGMAAGTSRQFFVFVSESLHNFRPGNVAARCRSEEHTSELQSPYDLVC